MMKIVLYSLLIVSFLFNNVYAGGVVYAPRQTAYNNKVTQKEQVVVREKIIQFGDNIRIVGIPVEETDAEYYFRKSKEGCAPALSEGDMQKLAGFLADELIKRGYTGGGGLGNPVEPKISEAEAKFTSLVNTRCATCHSGDNAKDGLSFIKDGKLLLEDLNDDVTKRLTKEELADIMFDSVLNQRMPKTGNKLTDEETAVFQTYKNELMKIKRGK